MPPHEIESISTSEPDFTGDPEIVTKNVLEMVPQGISDAYEKARQKEPHLFEMDETTLFQALRKSGRQPSPTDNRIRLSFWLEYERSKDLSKKMAIQNIFGGICYKSYFYEAYLKETSRLAWMLTPPVKYLLKMEEALDFGIDRLRDILAVPAVNDGVVNVKLAELQAKIVWMVEQRVMGAITQRVETKSLSMSVSAKDVENMAMEGTMEQLNKRLKELESRERKALNLPAPAPVAGAKDPEVLPAEDPDGS